MTSRAFWTLAERLRIPDEQALELIEYPGRMPRSGKRPRFRLTSKQARLASFLPEIEASLRAIGEGPEWLQRPNRSAPFSGQKPLAWMANQGAAGLAGVMQVLNRSVMRQSLRAS